MQICRLSSRRCEFFPSFTDFRSTSRSETALDSNSELDVGPRHEFHALKETEDDGLDGDVLEDFLMRSMNTFANEDPDIIDDKPIRGLTEQEAQRGSVQPEDVYTEMKDIDRDSTTPKRRDSVEMLTKDKDQKIVEDTFETKGKRQKFVPLGKRKEEDSFVTGEKFIEDVATYAVQQDKMAGEKTQMSPLLGRRDNIRKDHEEDLEEDSTVPVMMNSEEILKEDISEETLKNAFEKKQKRQKYIPIGRRKEEDSLVTDEEFTENEDSVPTRGKLIWK